jgi:hypothetical protein
LLISGGGVASPRCGAAPVSWSASVQDGLMFRSSRNGGRAVGWRQCVLLVAALKAHADPLGALKVSCLWFARSAPCAGHGRWSASASTWHFSAENEGPPPLPDGWRT